MSTDFFSFFNTMAIVNLAIAVLSLIVVVVITFSLVRSANETTAMARSLRRIAADLNQRPK
jgi:hypothetical protein